MHHHGPLDRYKHPIYGFIFFALIAFLSSNFATWGLEGITFAVIIAGGTVIAIPIGFKQLGNQWNKMLHGGPNRMDFLTAPAGYRRDRRRESPEEAARRSIVTPTPNRPLLRGDVIESHLIAPKKNVPAAPAWEWGGSPALYMAHDLTIPIDQFIGKAITGLGIRGSGKTHLAARIIEQLGRFPIPMLVGDPEEDYGTLPQLLGERCVIAGHPEWTARGNYEDCYWDVDITNATPIGEYLLEEGYQVILEMRSYPSKEEAACVFLAMIRGLFVWADKHVNQRVPCFVFLDEAQHFLPENGAPTRLSKETQSAMLTAFDDLNSIGRKRGLTPCLFTQRIAQIKKSAISGTEVWFFGKQELPLDLERYEEFVGKNEDNKQIVNRREMQTLPAGSFYVFEDGEYYRTQFWPRDTEHNSKTPGFQDAMDRYGSTSVSRRQPEVDTGYATLRDRERRDQDLEEDLEDDDDPLNDVSTKAAQPTATPVMAEKRTAEDIDINIAIAAYNAGYTSKYQLAKQFGLGESQGRALKNKIERIAKEKQANAEIQA